jgi:hypothetical protein
LKPVKKVSDAMRAMIDEQRRTPVVRWSEAIEAHPSTKLRAIG